ncbi:hypothetical protein BJV82DRAFT_718482 [Fennellomyces sp. T-0311]|nr:hypothetical protein BJV82DRAFT_718482 [Fennellomyces sp. T-0311]
MSTIGSTDQINLPDEDNFPKSLANQQFDLTALPSDIIFEIFACLDQVDCLTCMAVCRDWHRTIPRCTRSTWKAIQLDIRDIQLQNKRQICCLGDHVKTVTLDMVEDDKDLFDLMHKLFEWGCTMIESLELKDCVSDDQDKFVDALSKLAPHLTHLTLTDHVSNIGFLHVLNACPKLTHFTYSCAEETEWSFVDHGPTIEKKLSGTEQFPNLVYLCLDVALDPRLRLEPILKSCPNLRFFIGARNDRERYPDEGFSNLYRDTAIDPDVFFKWCPKITHLQTNYSYISPANKFQYIGSDQDGLRYLSLSDLYDMEMIISFMIKHQNTLEYVYLEESDSEIEDAYFSWDDMFEPLRLPQLRVLYSGDGVRYDHSSLLSLMEHSPLLEKLVRLSSSGDAIEDFTLQSFQHTFSFLRLLELCHTHIEVPLMTFLSRFPALEDLSITYSWISLVLAETGQGLNLLKRLYLKSNTWIYTYGKGTPKNLARFLRHLVMHSSQLETVQLITDPNGTETMINSECLKVVADIPTLKICELGLDDTGLSMKNEQETLKQFIILLKDSTKIQKIKLGNLRHLTYDILNELGELEYLTQFDTAPPSASSTNLPRTRLDGSSLLQMLRKTTSLANVNLRSITMGLVEHEFVEFIEQIMQEFPAYNVSWGALEKQKTSSDDKFLCNIVIERY